MSSDDLARLTKQAVSTVPSKFMLDGPTYARGAELGFAGADFYVAGRGGVLGDVDADIVTAAFAYFSPDLVREAWERSASVMSRRDAAEAFAACGHEWARTHLASVDSALLLRVAALGGKVVAAASPAAAPVFAGWRHLAVPDDAPAAALHVLNALRELRAAYHLGAVLGAGLTALEAFAVSSPGMAPLFGWAELPAVDHLASAWSEAEAATDRAVGRVLGVLDAGEADAFVAACAVVAESC